MSPACVYTFLFFWRDFSVLVVTLVFIRVSGATFLFGATFFHLVLLLFIWLFFIWRDFFLFGAILFIWRYFFSSY